MESKGHGSRVHPIKDFMKFENFITQQILYECYFYQESLFECF